MCLYDEQDFYYEEPLCVPNDSLDDLFPMDVPYNSIVLPSFRDENMFLQYLLQEENVQVYRDYESGLVSPNDDYHSLMTPSSVLVSPNEAFLRQQPPMEQQQQQLLMTSPKKLLMTSPKEEVSEITTDNNYEANPRKRSRSSENQSENTCSFTTINGHVTQVRRKRSSRTKKISWGPAGNTEQNIEVPSNSFEGDTGMDTGRDTGAITRNCVHCQATKTPQWREGPMGPRTLCNACGVRFKTGRLLPEYRPVSSPNFDKVQHSNYHKRVVKMRNRKAKVPKKL